MNKISEKKIKEIIEDLRKYKSLNNKKHKASYYYQARQNIIDSNHPIELIKEFLDELLSEYINKYSPQEIDKPNSFKISEDKDDADDKDKKKKGKKNCC